MIVQGNFCTLFHDVGCCFFRVVLLLASFRVRVFFSLYFRSVPLSFHTDSGIEAVWLPLFLGGLREREVNVRKILRWWRSLCCFRRYTARKPGG